MKKLSQKTNHIIVTSVICSLALATGAGLGLFFGMKYLKPEQNYNFSAEALEDDSSLLMKKYENAKGDYANFKGYELVNISLNKYDQTTNHYCKTDGYVEATGVTQTIKGTTIRNENSYFNESISASALVQVAKRFYQDTADEIDVYVGSSIKNGSTAKWDANPEKEFTASEYEEAYGKQLSRSSIYVISSKTVLNSSYTIDENNNYIVEMSLDPTLSVIRYVKQMKELSGLERYPTFSSVEMTFTLDENLNLISRQVHEQYEVFKLGFHQSDSYINDYYYPDATLSIPDLLTDCTYE